MTVGFLALPLDILLCISTFLTNPLDLLSLSQTCRAASLASQSYASYWSTTIPVAHLPRAARWEDLSATELRDACMRYAVSQRNWSSDRPTFELCQQLPFIGGPNMQRGRKGEWRPIRGTQWAWWLDRSMGYMRFFDLRTGLQIGELGVGCRLSDAIVSAISPVEWVLCYWRTWDVILYAQSFELLPEIVSISVILQQPTSSTQLNMHFRRIGRSPIVKAITLYRSSVQYQDYILKVYSYGMPNGPPTAYGIMLWNYKGGPIRYCEMSFRPLRLKVLEDILFVIKDRRPGSPFSKTCLCIHLPPLIHYACVDSGLPNRAPRKLAPCFEFGEGPGISERWTSRREEIYSIPHDAGTSVYPKYRFVLSSSHTSWEIFDVELDLTVPGPLKPFRSVKHHNTMLSPDVRTCLEASDGDLLVLFTSCVSTPWCINVRSFSQTLEESDIQGWRVSQVEELNRLDWSWLYVDRAAGYLLMGQGVDGNRQARIWWFDGVPSSEKEEPVRPQGKYKVAPLGVRSTISKVFTTLKHKAVSGSRGT